MVEFWNSVPLEFMICTEFSDQHSLFSLFFFSFFFLSLPSCPPRISLQQIALKANSLKSLTDQNLCHFLNPFIYFYRSLSKNSDHLRVIFISDRHIQIFNAQVKLLKHCLYLRLLMPSPA